MREANFVSLCPSVMLIELYHSNVKSDLRGGSATFTCSPAFPYYFPLRKRVDPAKLGTGLMFLAVHDVLTDPRSCTQNS